MLLQRSRVQLIMSHTSAVEVQGVQREADMDARSGAMRGEVRLAAALLLIRHGP